LGSVTADHLILVLFEFLLSSQESTFLLHGQLHVSLGLLLLLANDSGHLVIFINHLLDHGVYLLFFLDVLCVSFGADFFLLLDLVLDVLLVVNQAVGLFSLELSLKAVLVFLVFQVVSVNVGVLL